MSEHFTHTPVIASHRQILKIGLKFLYILSFLLLPLIGSPTPSSATILYEVQFEWDYDITLPGLMGYTIYQENQPIINITDPNILITDLNVYLETGQLNSFTITAYDNLGAESTPSIPLVIEVPPLDDTGNIPPVAEIVISSLSGPAPLSVEVSGSTSIDYDGIIFSYSWNFGDGGFSNFENDLHTFDIPGTYLVILTVTDDAGSLSTAEKTVTVTDPLATENLPPTPLIYTTTNNGPVPLDVLFDGTDSTDQDGIIIDYSWDFGDGTSGNGIFTNYTYTAIGIFAGKLTVTDDGGASASDQTTINVTASDPLNIAPVADITATPLTGVTPLTTTFSAINSTDPDGLITTYSWDFGDGSIASGTDVSHLYITPGTYTATLTVTDDMGATGQAQTIITASSDTLPTTIIYTDDFTTDTSSSYTNINGTLSVLNGTAHGANWQTTLASHNLSLGSSDHWIEAEVTYNGISDSGGLLARVDTATNTGYGAYFSAGKINLNHFASTSQTWLATSDGPYVDGTYALRLVVTGSTIQVYVDGVLKITKTDSTSGTGLHAGLRIYRGNANADVTIDNLRGGIGTPPPFPQQNNPPVAQNTSFTTPEDTAVSGTFIVSDLDGDETTTAIVSNGILGYVVITNPLSGTYSYTPNANVFGTDTFTYKANDGLADSNIATVTVTINAVNDPPSALPDSALTNEDQSVLINVLANDIDIDGDILSIISVGPPTSGTATISNNQILYVPNVNFHGQDSFTYEISDGQGGINSNTVEIAINSVNDPPQASDLSLTVEVDIAESGLLTASDVESDPLVFSIVGNGTLGTATITNPATGAYIYTPNSGAYGTDSFTFKANDGVTDSNIATVTVTIGQITASDLTDDFTIDSSSSYTSFSGTLTVLNGAAHGSSWQTTLATHNTPLSSSDHWVEAIVDYNGSSDSAGLLARVDTLNNTGYAVYFAASRINLISFTGTSQTWLTQYAGSYTLNSYTVRMVMTGNLIQVYVDGQLVIEKTDNTFDQGQHVGLRIYRGSTNTDITVDNLQAGSGTATPQLTIPETSPISDDFSTDTTASYVDISGTLSVRDGAAHGQNWASTLAFHNTALASSDHWVEAYIVYSGAIDSAGIAARIDTTNNTGYLVSFSSGKLNLNRFNGASHSWVASVDGSYTAGNYLVRLNMNGNTIQVYVDGILKIDTSDSTYPTGNNVGIYIYRGNGNTDVSADTFKADTK